MTIQSFEILEDQLTDREKLLRERCFHDFLLVISAAIESTKRATKDLPPLLGKTAIAYLQSLYLGLKDVSTSGLGTGECGCGNPDCSYIGSKPHHIN